MRCGARGRAAGAAIEIHMHVAHVKLVFRTTTVLLVSVPHQEGEGEAIALRRLLAEKLPHKVRPRRDVAPLVAPPNLHALHCQHRLRGRQLPCSRHSCTK